MRSSSESLLLLDIFSEVTPLLLPPVVGEVVPELVAEEVACRMFEMSPTKEEDDVGDVRRDDVIWGGGNPDHADTTLLLLLLVVVVMIGQDVVVKRSNTLRLMLDLLVWPLVVLVIVKYCSVDSCLCVVQ